MITIKATYNEPSKSGLWLIKTIDVNHNKFCGKRGRVLSSKEQEYFQAQRRLSEMKYIIAAIDDVKEEDMNFRFERLKKLSMSADDISYQFDFGWGSEIYAETLEGLQNKVMEKLKECQKHIEKAKQAEESIIRLGDEFDSYLKEVKC